MSAPARSLQELLQALGNARGLRGRLRVLARSADLLRSLSKEERERVALRVGSDWVWKRLEKSFLGDGELDATESLVRDAFERMGSADPAELRDLARAARRGDHEQLQDALLATMRDALEDEAEELEEEAAREAEPHVTEESEHDAPLMEVADRREPGDESEARETALPRQESSPRDLALASLRAGRADPAPPPGKPSAPVASVPPRPAAAKQADSVATGATGATGAAVARQAPRASTVSDASSRDVARVGTLGSAGEKLALLRALREQPERVRRLTPAARAGLVARLGAGWAAKRAVSQLIRARLAGDLDEALALVARLDSDMRRTWCLGDLLDHWELDLEEERRVIASAPSEGAARRLRRKCSSIDLLATPVPELR